MTSRAIASPVSIFSAWGNSPRRWAEPIGDVVSALKAGLEGVMPKMGPWRHGVVLDDGDDRIK